VGKAQRGQRFGGNHGNSSRQLVQSAFGAQSAMHSRQDAGAKLFKKEIFKFDKS
jgi:hypothetical protein